MFKINSVFQFQIQLHCKEQGIFRFLYFHISTTTAHLIWYEVTVQRRNLCHDTWYDVNALIHYNVPWFVYLKNILVPGIIFSAWNWANIVHEGDITVHAYATPLLVWHTVTAIIVRNNSYSIQFHFICNMLFTVDCHKKMLYIVNRKEEKWEISPQIAYEVKNSLVGEKPSNSAEKKNSPMERNLAGNPAIGGCPFSTGLYVKTVTVQVLRWQII